MSADVDDATLLKAWGRGDEDAGRQLLRRSFGPLRRFFRNKAPDVADELAQKTFVALLEHPERLQQAASFRAYVFGIARNQLLSHLRAMYRAADALDPAHWSIVELSGGARGALIAEAQQELVRRALQRLAIDDQVAIELFYFDDLSIAEIASVQASTPSAIKMRLSRARARLKDHLAEMCGEAELLDSVNADLDRWIKTLPKAMARSTD